MKRREVEIQVAKIHQDVKSQIELAPVPAVLAAFILGIVFTTFKTFLFPIALLVIASALVAWLVSEPPTDEELAEYAAEGLNRRSQEAVERLGAAGFDSNGMLAADGDEDQASETKEVSKKSRGSSSRNKTVSTKKSGSKSRLKTKSPKGNGSRSKTSTARKSSGSRSRSRSTTSNS